MTVLVLRALGLGDVLTGVAALRGVRRALPGHRIVLAAPRPLGQLLVDHGIVDTVLPSQGLARLPWPWAGPCRTQDASRRIAIDLHGSGPRSHRVLQATRPDTLIAFDSPDAGHAGPDWDDDEHEVLRWCRLVRSVGGYCGPEDLRLGPPAPDGARAEVIVHPGAAAEARRWPVSRWARVVDALVAQGHYVVLTGSEAEQDLCARVRLEADAGGAVRDTSGRLGLPALAGLVSTARLVVSGDTGIAHLATAYGTPSVTLFGPTPPALWGPTLDPHRHVVIWHGRRGAPRRDPNAGRLDPALARTAVDEVVAACESMLTRLPETANGTMTPSGPDRPSSRPAVPSPAPYARG
ncbi:glycosyltransferase family 9 protein [Promicromonospora sp. NPDC023805]|uniref:glycosyltransferase family 9 protein n=1 Tax=Promicromonospora sp. NPDC023805 TaxID=3154696 RepID=UPI0033E0D4B0